MIGSPHHHFETIGSTNAHARELAERGAPPGTVVTSAEQTEGRGRQGRAWSTPAGKALAWSAVLPLDGAAPGLVPLRAGLAACEAVEALGYDEVLRQARLTAAAWSRHVRVPA